MRLLLGFLFFVSGLCGLIFESLWTRQLVLVFGSTTFALSTVLCAFMGGLALGSYLAGKRIDRIVRPEHAIIVYGLLEGVVGLYGLVFPTLLEVIAPINRGLWGSLHLSFFSFSLVRFVLVFVLLLLPTTCMGATLPVLARYFAQVGPAIGRHVGTLYALNTFGGVTGTLIGGFLLMPMSGISATNRTACILDLALCVATVAIGWRGLRSSEAGDAAEPPPEPVPEEKPGRPLPPPEAPPTLQQANAAMSALFVTGILAMVYQIAWTRALSLVLGSSVYAFALILTGFLIGLASGSAVYARRTAHKPGQLANLAVANLCIAAAAIAGLYLTPALPVLFFAAIRKWQLTPLTAFLINFGLASALVMPPTFFMGMLFPATLRVWAEARAAAAARGIGVGQSVGTVYAVNTFGNIAGSFLGGFVFVPFLGLQRSIAVMAAANICTAAFLALHLGRRRALAPIVSALVLAGVLVGFYQPWNRGLMTAGVFRISRFAEFETDVRGFRDSMKDTWGFPPAETPDAWEQAARATLTLDDAIDTQSENLDLQRMLFYQEGIITTVSTGQMIFDAIGETGCWLRQSLKVNGKADASLSVRYPRPQGKRCRDLADDEARDPTGSGGWVISPGGDAETQILSGLLPVLLHPGTPRRALVVGWGSGMTVGATMQSPVDTIEAVELERAVIDGAAVFRPYNHNADRDPRVKLVDNDGRNYLEMTNEQHDVIISEPSNPWITGASNLFTREFFRTVRSRLAPGGRYLQWLQIYEIAPDNVRSILGTLARVFPEVLVFQPQHSRADLLIVAGDGVTLDWKNLERRFADPRTRAELERLDILNPEDVVARLLLSAAGVRTWTRGFHENTDDSARVEYRAPLDLINFRRFSFEAIGKELAGFRGDPLLVTKAPPPDAALRLAHSYLRVARPEDALLMAEDKPGVRWDRVRALAKQLQDDNPVLDPTVIVPNDPRQWDLKTALAGKKEEVPSNLALVRSKLDLQREAALGFALLGDLKRQAEDNAAATLYFTAALRSDPGPALRRAVLVHAGKVYQAVGRYDLAYFAFRDALAIPAPQPASGPAPDPGSLPATQPAPRSAPAGAVPTQSAPAAAAR
ncbi:MAG: fused MFS/spermidine synthase [Deltaproteobacteria bacterium]|nr:fused MFS/spermidine synthase [Deltaproteobacteria bacterium]